MQLNFSPLSGATLAHVATGRLRALAVLAPQRSSLLPQVPTLAEAGFGELSIPGWLALLAPPRTPPQVVDRLHREVSSILQQPQLRSQIERAAMQPDGAGPAALAAQIAGDAERLKAWIREYGIVAE